MITELFYSHISNMKRRSLHTLKSFGCIHLSVFRYRLVKVIPQKLKLPMNFFETFPECSLPNTVSKNTIKTIGHHSRLRDVIG